MLNPVRGYRHELHAAAFGLETSSRPPNSAAGTAWRAAHATLPLSAVEQADAIILISSATELHHSATSAPPT
jgi:hypothetical protein